MPIVQGEQEWERGMKYRLTIILCVAMVLLAGFAYTHQKPQVITEYVEVIDEVRVPNYIIVSEPEYIGYPVYVEIEKEVPQESEDWDSIEELKAFLEADDTDSHSYYTANEQGVISFVGICRVKAEQLRDNAEAIGKRLETESLTRTEAIAYFDIGQKLKPWDRHDVCKARIGNEMWFVEPSTDELFLAYYIP